MVKAFCVLPLCLQFPLALVNSWQCTTQRNFLPFCPLGTMSNKLRNKYLELYSWCSKLFCATICSYVCTGHDHLWATWNEISACPHTINLCLLQVYTWHPHMIKCSTHCCELSGVKGDLNWPCHHRTWLVLEKWMKTYRRKWLRSAASMEMFPSAWFSRYIPNCKCAII